MHIEYIVKEWKKRTQRNIDKHSIFCTQKNEKKRKEIERNERRICRKLVLMSKFGDKVFVPSTLYHVREQKRENDHCLIAAIRTIGYLMFVETAVCSTRFNIGNFFKF